MKIINVITASILIYFISQPLVLNASDLGVLVHEDAEGSVFYSVTSGDTVHPPNQRLVLLNKEGGSETVFSKEVGILGAEKPNHVYREAGSIALILGSSVGVTHYELYEKQEDGWKLAASSPLGALPLDSEGITMTALRDFKLRRNLRPETHFQITDIPLTPEVKGSPVRLTLVDGKPHQPRGVSVPMAVWDQPLEKILSDHQARLKAGSSGNAEPARPDSGKSQQPEKKPESDSSAARAKESEPSQSSLLKPLSIGLAVLVVAFAAWHFTR